MVYTLARMAESQNICIRLHDEEPEKWTEILRRALQRDPHASKSAVARALFKFPPYEEKLLTEDDRKYFRTRLRSRSEAEVVGRSVEMPPNLTATRDRKRKTG